MNEWRFLFFCLLAISTSAIAVVSPESCLDINRSVGVSMIDEMVRDFDIEEQDILLNKTKLVLLAHENVTKEMALLYAKEDQKEPVMAALDMDENIKIYREDNPKNIIVKYDFVNRQNKHNITIASLLINDYECSVRFNGYIVVKREF